MVASWREATARSLALTRANSSMLSSLERYLVAMSMTTKPRSLSWFVGRCKPAQGEGLGRHRHRHQVPLQRAKHGAGRPDLGQGQSGRLGPASGQENVGNDV